MKNKKLMIGIAVLVAAAAGMMILKKQKDKKNANLLGGSTGSAPSAPGIAPTGVPTSSGTPAGSVNVRAVTRDGSKGTAQLRVPKGIFKTGDNVKVNAGNYQGTYQVWHVYTRDANEDHVYLQTPYTGNATGFALKV